MKFLKFPKQRCTKYQYSHGWGGRGSILAIMQFPEEVLPHKPKATFSLPDPYSDKGGGRNNAGAGSIGQRHLRNYSLWSCRSRLCRPLLRTVLASVVTVVLLISICSQYHKKVLRKKFGNRRLSDTGEQELDASSICEGMAATASDSASPVGEPSSSSGIPMIELISPWVATHTQHDGGGGYNSRQAPAYADKPAAATQLTVHDIGRPQSHPPRIVQGTPGIWWSPAEEAAAVALLQLSTTSPLLNNSPTVSEDNSTSSRYHPASPDSWISAESVGQQLQQWQQEQASFMLAHPLPEYPPVSHSWTLGPFFEQAFYHLPAVEPHVVLPQFDVKLGFTFFMGHYRVIPSVLHAQKLLSLQTISGEGLVSLKMHAQRIVSHCIRYERKPVTFNSASRGVVKLGLRFLMLDIVFCTLQLLHGNMLAGWWIEFAKAMPHEAPPYRLPGFSTQQRRFNGALVQSLSNAIQCFKSGNRPPKSCVIHLKRMLFCSPFAPKLFRRFLL